MSYGQPGGNFGAPYNDPMMQAPRSDRDNFAIGALVLGVLNLCSWFIPLCGCPMALIGIGLGVYGLESNNRTLAMVGIGLSSLGLLASLGNAVVGVLLSVNG